MAGLCGLTLSVAQEAARCNLAPTTVTVTVPPSNGAAICSNGSCTYTPAPGFVGSDTFTYRICDTLLACDTALVDVTVNPVAGGAAAPPANSPPVAQDDTLPGRIGQGATRVVRSLVEPRCGRVRRQVGPEQVDHLLPVQPATLGEREHLHERAGIAAAPLLVGDHGAADRYREASEEADARIHGKGRSVPFSRKDLQR